MGAPAISLMGAPAISLMGAPAMFFSPLLVSAPIPCAVAAISEQGHRQLFRRSTG